MNTQHCFSIPFKVTLGSREDWTRRTTPDKVCDQLVWFTDGSRTGTQSGAGIYGLTPRTKISINLGKYCTVFQAEVFAILSCAQRGLEKGYHGKRILILTDSQSALKALSSDQVKSKLVWECLNALIALSSRNSLELRWVPGHRDIQGNESADELAKKGTEMPFVGPEAVVGISTCTAKTSVKTWIRDKHQISWQTYPGQKLARKLLSGPNSSLSSSLLKLDRRGIRRVVALITGHGNICVQWDYIEMDPSVECANRKRKLPHISYLIDRFWKGRSLSSL